VLLGQISPSYGPPATMSSKKKVFVSSYVWLQITPEKLSFKLQESEIFSVFWVPVSTFQNPGTIYMTLS